MTRNRLDNQYIYPVPTRYTKELIIALKTESTTQKQRISLELVKDINTTINNNKNMIITRYLPSKNILIVFQEIPEKQK